MYKLCLIFIFPDFNLFFLILLLLDQIQCATLKIFYFWEKVLTVKLLVSLTASISVLQFMHVFSLHYCNVFVNDDGGCGCIYADVQKYLWNGKKEEKQLCFSSTKPNHLFIISSPFAFCLRFHFIYLHNTFYYFIYFTHTRKPK